MIAGRNGPAINIDTSQSSHLSYSPSSSKMLSVVDTIMQHNVAKNNCQSNCTLDTISYGGAAYVYNLTSLFLDRLVLVNNSAQRGGAVYADGHHNTSITNCYFTANSGALTSYAEKHCVRVILAIQ